MGLEIELGNDLRVRADPDAVSDVLLALFDYACDRAMAETSIRVLMAVSSSGFVEVALACEGLAIPDRRRESLFDPSLPSVDSSGEVVLGLTICATLVGQMGGTISAEALHGGGTALRFTLPVGPRTMGLVFGRVACELGHVTEAQISEVLGSRLPSTSRGKRIGQLLIERGYISEPQRDDVLKELTRRMSAPHPRIEGATLRDGLLGRIAVENGSLTERQLNEALRLQENYRAEGKRVQIGRILVDMGFLTGEQLVESLLDQGVRVMFCPRCSGSFNLLSSNLFSSAVCSNCGASVEPAETADILDVSGEILPLE